MDIQITENLDYEGPDKECLLYCMFITLAYTWDLVFSPQCRVVIT